MARMTSKGEAEMPLHHTVGIDVSKARLDAHRLPEGLFPQCEVQLCTVHMLRNAQKHLSKQDFRIFRSDWQLVRSA